MKDNLNDKSPLFALPIKKNLKTSFKYLSYDNNVKADKAITDHMGFTDHNFRNHLRRKGESLTYSTLVLVFKISRL